MLRPASTRWFEVLCPRGESVRAAAELARTLAVETQVRPGARQDFSLGDLSQGLADYQALHTRYAPYWERKRLRTTPLATPPEQVLAQALARIHTWRSEADPVIDELQAVEEELARLKLLLRVLEALGDSRLDFAALADGGPVLGSFCAILPEGPAPRLPEPLLLRVVPWEEGLCFLLVGPEEVLEPARQQVKAVKGRILERPPWLQGNAAQARALIRAQRERLWVRLVHLNAELEGLFHAHDLEVYLGEAAWLDWFARHVGGLATASDHLVWITGWTDDLRGASLVRALDRSGTRSLLRFAAAPAGVRPPQVLVNPAWLKPFEVFARALGVPGADEADPTPLLAVVVPLLFGYMFGDLGQGLVLVAAGWWLRRRFAAASLLIAGGASAAAFGLVFGSLFAREDLIPALWLHPLDAPLPVLLVPLVFAVFLLSLGQLLAGLGAVRRGEIGRWLLTDAGFLLLYLGVVALLSGAASAWPALVGLVWYLAGSLVAARRLLGGLAALAHLAEGGLQLLVNTLSFARVGAFALAHAALSAAVVGMADATGSPAFALPVLILGNLVIVLLEGLVVSIQTTRLVLFEFFNRFLRGTGRVFLPLPPPPSLLVGVRP